MPEWLNQIEELLRHHLPTSESGIPVGPLALTIIAGLALSLAGARLIRASLAIVFMGGGAVVGAEIAKSYGYSVIPGILAGAIVLGIVGYFLFRMWVSTLAGLLMATIAVSTVGAPELPAVWQQFEQRRTATGPNATEFALPTAVQQQAARQLTFAQYCLELGQFIRSNRPELVRNTAIVAVVAFLFGAAVGLFAYQWAMILGTAIAGTSLLVSALVTLANRYWPASLDWCRANPRASLGILAGWLLIAVITQHRGVRKTVKVVQAATTDTEAAAA
jgi:hypothetical protein